MRQARLILSNAGARSCRPRLAQFFLGRNPKSEKFTGNHRFVCLFICWQPLVRRSSPSDGKKSKWNTFVTFDNDTFSDYFVSLSNPFKFFVAARDGLQKNVWWYKRNIRCTKSSFGDAEKIVLAPLHSTHHVGSTWHSKPTLVQTWTLKNVHRWAVQVVSKKTEPCGVLREVENFEQCYNVFHLRSKWQKRGAHHALKFKFTHFEFISQKLQPIISTIIKKRTNTNQLFLYKVARDTNTA